MKLSTYSFQRALPVWEKGTATRMNHTVSFVCAELTEEGAVIAAGGQRNHPI